MYMYLCYTHIHALNRLYGLEHIHKCTVGVGMCMGGCGYVCGYVCGCMCVI